MKLSAIALQEVDQNSPISGYRDVCFELAEALGFSAVYSSELVYLDHKRNPLVNDGRPCAKGNAILTRLPLKKELEMLRLTPQYDFYNHRTSFDITQNNHWGNRTALITELDYGKGIRFISTHLEDKTSSYRRGKQALDIIEKNLKDKAEEVFVCGDFNTFWSVLERTDRLFKLAGYERTIKLASTINMKLPLRLDNIYAKTHKKLANSGVYPQSNGSDHKMVYAQYI